MTTEQDGPSEEDQTLARHRAFAEVLKGERAMAWSDWAMIIDESKCLTSKGKQAAFWATETLQQTLKADFFQKVAKWLAKMQAQGDPDLAPNSHPIFSIALWPAANDSSLVYSNLIRLAAQIQLFLPEEKNRHKGVLGKLREHPDPIRWLSTLLQFEVAALGVRAGWEILLEPDLGNDKKADVRLTRGSTVLFVEATTIRSSDAERQAYARNERLFWQLYKLGSQYDVRISGKVSLAALEQDGTSTSWLKKVEEAVSATVEDGQDRPVPGPGGVLVKVFRPTGAAAWESWGIEGDPVEAHTFGRLLGALKDKNDQAEGGRAPVWVRVDEFAGVWEFIRGQGWTLAQALAFFTDYLQNELVFFPNLAGVILSPGLLPAGNVPPDSLVRREEDHGAIAIRRPVPGPYFRETLIIPQAGLSEAEAKIFAEWYQNEATWLDWVLERQGYPRFDALIQEEPGPN